MLEETEKLRRLLGETIPEDGDESSTLFTDDEVQQLLQETPNLEVAALEGWRRKAAHFANLVDTTEGNAQRKFGQLFQNAQAMIKLYTRSSSGPTEGRTRVGKIHREAPQW